MSEEEIDYGIYDEKQLDTYVDENGFKYEKNEEGQWCLLIMSKMNDDD
jgi:hypothetical protein